MPAGGLSGRELMVADALMERVRGVDQRDAGLRSGLLGQPHRGHEAGVAGAEHDDV